MRAILFSGSARGRVVTCAAIGVAVGFAVAAVAGARLGALSGIDAMNSVFLLVVWRTVWPLDGEQAERHAEHEDPTAATADLMVLGAALASLAAVAFALAGASKAGGSDQLVRVIVGLGSIALSWATVHTLFTLRYARIYYRGRNGGVDFNQRAQPDYADFAYLSFTVGMTFQVSDTDICTPPMRRTVLRHALLAYVFGAGIIAMSINLIATVSTS